MTEREQLDLLTHEGALQSPLAKRARAAQEALLQARRQEFAGQLGKVLETEIDPDLVELDVVRGAVSFLARTYVDGLEFTLYTRVVFDPRGDVSGPFAASQLEVEHYRDPLSPQLRL